jgi:hypothetical protein
MPRDARLASAAAAHEAGASAIPGGRAGYCIAALAGTSIGGVMARSTPSDFPG